MEASFLSWVSRRDPIVRETEPLASHLGAFRILLLAHLATQAWAWALDPIPAPWTFPPRAVFAAAGILTLLMAVAWSAGVGPTGSRRMRIACLLALPIVALEVAWIFPGTPNHVFLSLVLLALVSSFDLREPAEARSLLETLRWVAVLIFVWAGLQKCVHGLYFRGEFLSWMIAHGIDRWAQLFGLIVPEQEIARLAALPRFAPGSGPYRVDSLLFVALSNFVWIGEIALGVGMVFARTRVWAALGGIALVFAIQGAPREFMFALLYTNLLLLFVPGEPNRRFMLLFLAIYAGMLAALLGAPLPFLLKAGGGL